jgi:hypothetical protein
MPSTLDPNRPPTVFKYEPATERAIQNLEYSSIYFSSPENFNDPFDCAIAALIEQDPAGFMDWLIDFMPGVPIATLAPAHLEELKGQLVQKTNAMIQKKASTMGVTCFSECVSNLLMWAHYASKFAGFSIEFGTVAEPFEGVKQVEYSNIGTSCVVKETKLVDYQCFCPCESLGKPWLKHVSDIDVSHHVLHVANPRKF